MARSDDDQPPSRSTQLDDYKDGTAPSVETPAGERPFVITTNDQRERVHVSHPAGTAEAGFDVTKFPTAESFRQLVSKHHLEGPYEIPLYPSRQNPDLEAGELKAWAWADEYVVLLVCANPLTGVRAHIQRQPEPGYASYIVSRVSAQA